MIKYSIAFFTILLLVVSCNANRPTYESFPEEKLLQSETLTISEDTYIKFPFRVRLFDSCLYIMDLHASHYYLHQFEYPSMRHIRSFAKRGEAPDEFLDAENIRLKKQQEIWVLDANKRKIVAFDLQKKDSIQINIKLSESLVRTLDFDFYNDSTFIVPDYTGKNRFCFLDINGEIIKKSFQIPLRGEKEKGSGMALAQAWRSFLNYNAANGIMAMVTQLGQVVEIYDLKNDSLIHVCYGKEGEPRYQLSKEGYASPSGIMGYSDVYVGAENIYAIFWGYSFDDIKKNKVMEEGGRHIHVFDLQGKPVIEYTLDRAVVGFFVDEKRRKIIALDVNNDQPIVEYSF